MTPLALAGAAILSLAGATGAGAQASPPPYDCQNDVMRIAVPAQAMPAALAALSRQTRCPISHTVDIAKLRSTSVSGRMRPVEALVALVRGSGLEAQPIRQGMTVGRSDQQEIGARVDTLDRCIRARQAEGGLSSSRGAALRRSLATIRTQATDYARQQGFVSAGEKASFQRTFQEVEAALRG